MSITQLPCARRPLRILAVGAHPDDIEIGAGALLHKAGAEGHEVFVLVMTDGIAGATRRREATAAAAALGVPPERLFFAGCTDGHLRVDATVVGRVRELTAAVAPDVVVTHTDADSHNDHVETHRTARAAFRGSVFLHFSVHVSCEPSRFSPRVFVAVAGDRLDAKQRALDAHGSQQATIGRVDLAAYEARLGHLARLSRAEAFEVGAQTGAMHLLGEVLDLSESPFHRLWSPLVRDTDAVLLYPSVRDATEEAELNAGRDRLRSAFIDRWGGLRLPLREVFANGPEAVQAVRAPNLVLVGDPAANAVVRHLSPSLPGVGWLPGVDAPRSGGSRRRPQGLAARGRRGPGAAHDVEDLGVISRVDRPGPDAGTVLYVGGSTPRGTRAGLEFLADPGAVPDVDALLSQDGSVEVVFTVGPTVDDVRVVDHRQGPAPV
ncbi:PIG-L deacetylase family protein, partial [Geodermatophilus maliterrae]